MAHLSVVIPVYQAEGFLEELYRRLKASLNRISKDHEIVFVEDCGGDKSWPLLLQLARKDKKVKAIQLSRNFGQHYAITAGLDNVNADWVVVMDCDLQDRPEDIARLYEKALEGFDVVFGVRANRQDSFMKRFVSSFFYKVFNVFTNLEYDGRIGNFCIVSRKVVECLGDMREKLRFFGGILEWMGFPSAKVEVQHPKSSRGKSSYSYSKLLKLGSDAIIAYSDKPLWLAVQAGFTLAFISFFLGGYHLYRAFSQGAPVMGWASLIVSIYFLSGVIIGILGIVGIYVGKTFDETKKRPLYVIREKRNLPH